MILKRLIRPSLLFVLSVLISQPTLANDKENIPSPLTIKQALSYAKDHPRTRLSLQAQRAFPATQTLFLQCHQLTFNNAASIDNQINSIETPLISPLKQQQLRILQAFFDVLLADLNNGYINEKMSGSYIVYDRAKNRQELKETSELTVSLLDAKYKIVLQQFRASEAMQRLSRSTLAQALNHPTQLPADLSTPKLFNIPDELPELNASYENSLKNNRWINRLHKQFSDDDEDQINAVIQMTLRQQILANLLRLKVLKSAKQQTMSENNARELALDMSRSLYEMEVKADLGNSMIQQSKAQFEDMRFSFCQFLSWAQLNALQGKALLLAPPAPPTAEANPSTEKPPANDTQETSQ